MSSSSSTW